MRLTVLLSEGRHPASGRPRLAPDEAGALGLARALAAAAGPPGARVEALHAGSAAAAEPLGAALGLGAGRLEVLAIGAGDDPLPALVAALAADPPGLVLAGPAAETGAGSGTLPYALAEVLGWPVVEAVTALAAAGDGGIEILRAEAGGRRRRLRLVLPALAIVRSGAAPVGLPALGPMRRGAVAIRAAPAAVANAAAAWELRPARRRPRRLEAAAAATRPTTGVPGPATAEKAAGLILDYLRSEGLLAAPEPPATPEPPDGSTT